MRPTTQRTAAPGDRRSTFTRFAVRRPVTAFLLGALGIGLPLLAIPFIVGLPSEPFLLLLTYGALLGSALVVTRAADGRGAVRRLLSRLLIWRFGLARWAIIVLAVPVLTLAVGAAFGTLEAPADGWPWLAATYLFGTFITGALILNLWEETAWGGFVQSRLMERHGLLAGSLLTAVPFIAIHIPLLFTPGWTWRDVGVDFAVLAAVVPFYRYLIGMHLLDTGGSLLAAGIQHASWNASQKLGAGDWPALVAVILLTILVALARRRRGADSRPTSASPPARGARRSSSAV